DMLRNNNVENKNVDYIVINPSAASFITLIRRDEKYKVIPAKHLRIRDVMPGSLFAASSSFLISHLFSLYTGSFGNYSALYGSIAGIIVICTWMFLFSLMLVIGAEINACLYEITRDTKLYRTV
ncbi:MAG: YihY/virulence factor BrkB family protein, partial [Firmicutes bacterium]|nr:YihY/virulence factor BrkB family protein [Bacillota bacterium]